MFATSSARWKLLGTIVVAVVLGLGMAKPGGTAGPTEPYVVRAGDTLWSIAEARYDGDPRKAVWRIRKDNELGKRSIMAGEVLDLPTG